MKISWYFFFACTNLFSISTFKIFMYRIKWSIPLMLTCTHILKYHIDISLKEFLKILKVRVFCDTWRFCKVIRGKFHKMIKILAGFHKTILVFVIRHTGILWLSQDLYYLSLLFHKTTLIYECLEINITISFMTQIK